MISDFGTDNNIINDNDNNNNNNNNSRAIMKSFDCTCKKCGSHFGAFDEFMEHSANCKAALPRVRRKPTENKFECTVCDKSFARSYNLRRHLETMHANQLGMGGGFGSPGRLFACGICQISFPSRAEMKQHRRDVHERVTTSFRCVDTAHKRAIKIYRMDYPKSIMDVSSALRHSHDQLCLRLEKERAETGGFFKFGLVLSVEFIQIDEENLVTQSIVVPFRSRVMRVMPMNELDQELTDAYELIQNSVLSFLDRGSGWIIDEILSLDIEATKCLDLAGRCYSSHTVSWSRGSGFVIDPVGFHPTNGAGDHHDEFGSGEGNMDCFYIAVARHFRRDTSNRQELLRYAAENFMGVEPDRQQAVGMREIAAFESKNEDIAISVIFLDENNKVLPVRASSRVGAEHHVVLLLTYVEPDHDANLFQSRSLAQTQAYMHYICIEVSGGKETYKNNNNNNNSSFFIFAPCLGSWRLLGETHPQREGVGCEAEESRLFQLLQRILSAGGSRQAHHLVPSDAASAHNLSQQQGQD